MLALSFRQQIKVGLLAGGTIEVFAASREARLRSAHTLREREREREQGLVSQLAMEAYTDAASTGRPAFSHSLHSQTILLAGSRSFDIGTSCEAGLRSLPQWRGTVELGLLAAELSFHRSCNLQASSNTH